MVDNIDHIQSGWLTPGIKVCQVGLQFGADDVGSILIEENVVYAAGVRNRTNESELRRIIFDAGYIPAQRDTLYRSYVLNNSLLKTSGSKRFAQKTRITPPFFGRVPNQKHVEVRNLPRESPYMRFC